MSFSLGDLIKKSTVQDDSGKSSFSLDALQSAVIGGAVKTADEVISRENPSQVSQSLTPQKPISEAVKEKAPQMGIILAGALIIGGLIYWRMKK